MVYLAMERTGHSPEETVIIGDRLYTDVACGLNAGIDGILVLSGESTMDTVAASDVKPTAIYDNVARLLEQLRQAN